MQIRHRTVTARLIFAAAIVALLPLCVSCSHPDAAKVRNRHSVVRLLDRADTMLGTNDSAALAALDSIDATALSGRKLSARYALLYSEAMYKNYITAPDDSLIMVAVRYYSVGNDTVASFHVVVKGFAEVANHQVLESIFLDKVHLLVFICKTKGVGRGFCTAEIDAIFLLRIAILGIYNIKTGAMLLRTKLFEFNAAKAVLGLHAVLFKAERISQWDSALCHNLLVNAFVHNLSCFKWYNVIDGSLLGEFPWIIQVSQCHTNLYIQFGICLEVGVHLFKV